MNIERDEINKLSLAHENKTFDETVETRRASVDGYASACDDLDL